MQSLLRWSIENSTPNDAGTPPAPRSDLDPAIIDQILGRPDAELMKENLQVALDEERELDDRVQALDNFEMLVENIDNANDLEKLKLWELLHGLLTSETSEDDIKRLVLWIVGTAVQNNPSAQTSYLSFNPLPSLLSFLSPTPSHPSPAKTRSRAVYALSGLLKHNSAAVDQLTSANGWEILKAALGDSDIGVRRKVAFLVGTLLLPSSAEEEQQQQAQSSTSSVGTLSTSTALATATASTATSLHTPNSSNAPIHPNSHASMLTSPSFFSTSAQTRQALEEHGILETLVEGLVNPVPFGEDGEDGEGGDEEFEGKCVAILNTYLVSLKGQLPPSQKEKLATFVKGQLEKVGVDGLVDRWSLGTEDIEGLKSALGLI
ncbi:hypothetical protein QCA50_008323 [Cerrena zonata]|uniref:Nucleotide exchange factor Fes1 domain-containing protein n=1 Tax=Cerrena zonata TaxID=2478898 RepID=A0AAW0G654_9APHY